MNTSAIKEKMAILKILLALCLLIHDDFCYFVKGQTPRFCSFDNGLCGFVNDQSGTDDFDWTRLNNAAETVTKFRIVTTRVPFRVPPPIWGRYRRRHWHRFRYVTKRVPYQAVVRGPQRDHTTGRGFYVYAKPRVESVEAGNLARLVSPVYTNVSCLQFYYFMHGNDIGGLEVLVKLGENTPIKVWSQFGSVANSWKLAKIPVNAHGNQTVKMYFQAIVGESNRASVGIDDVNILSDQCTFYPTTAKPKEIIMDGNGSCAFDHTLCSYQNSNNDDYDWKRVNVGTMISTAGPTKDHTTSLGSYVHAEGATRGSKARLVSPLLYNTSCVSFYYYMFGSQIGTLNVYVMMQGNSTRLLQLTGNQGNRWYKSQLVLGQDDLNTTYKIVFEAINGDGFSGGIAIDDISVLRILCWSQLPTSSPSIRFTTAPAFKDGSIRLVNGQTNYEGRVEVFHSGVWGTVCDDLWDMPDANVVCKMLGFPGAVKTTKSQVYGRGVGTIWLDDVNCKGSEASIAKCSHGGWGNNNCDHYEDAGVICRLDLNTTLTGDCSFEYDMCGYRNGDRTNSEFDWTRKRGPTPSAGTGPQKDQSRKGYYMYTEVSQGDTGARAKLTSPVLPVNTKCMSFYYHMRGSGIGWLNVYMEKENTHTAVKLWTLSGEQGNSWLQGQVPINVTGGEGFKVIFEGVRGNSERGDIAIDTISVSNTSCPMKPAKAKPIPVLNALEGQVRLVGDPNPLRGRVEIFHREQWGTICNNMWSDEDATVVCKMLGYSGLGRIGSTLNRTPGVVPIWLDSLQCTGGESTLLQCPKNPWGRHNCDHSKDSWAVCSNGTFDDECSRYKKLNDAHRARTFFGQVNECDRNSGIFPDQWHRFMGPAGKQMASSCVSKNRCGTRAPGWLNGDHPTIKEGMVTRKVCFSFFGDCCKWSTSVRVKNCSGFYVYELQKPPTCKLRYCGNGPEPRGIRLAGSKNNYSGRVEVLHNDEWGTVCSDLWDIDDATVACRMLGFPGASFANKGGKFGTGTGKIWLDDLQCTGNENNLAFCKHAGWGKSNCDHVKDAGVICISEEVYMCDFENDLCFYTTTTLNNGPTWVRKQAVSSAPCYQPAYDYTFGTNGTKACWNGWTKNMYKGYCYNLNERQDRITWHEAEKKCQAKKSWLADIREHDEIAFLAAQGFPRGIRQLFIGVHEINGSGVWKYLDGTLMNLKNIWHTGKPTDAGGEDCAAIVTWFRSQPLNDVGCNVRYSGISYLCKGRPQRRVLGHYLRVPPKSGIGKRTPVATLVSPDIPASLSCLSFYYHIVGENVDSLRVLLRSSSQKDVLVWVLPGNHSTGYINQSTEWSKAQILLTRKGSGQFQFVIQAARLGSFSDDGEIAIDDIKISSSPSHLCYLYPPNARPTTWDSNGSCNFGNGTCGYISDKSDQDYNNWFRHDLSLPGNIMPRDVAPYDHSTYSYNSGSYMFMQHVIGQNEKQSARLISPPLSPNQAKCLGFYFYFYNTSVSSGIELTVNVRPTTQATSVADEIPVWRLTNEDLMVLGYWNKGVLPLQKEKEFQVIFEGVITGGGVIGLDDIFVSSSMDCAMTPDIASNLAFERPSSVIRLASSASNESGRVEVYHNGRWGTICGNTWTLNNAHVVCRQLGYESALDVVPCCRIFGRGTGRIWLGDVRCSGKEASIATCSHKGWGNNKCVHTQDAAVICKSSVHQEVPLRLNGTRTNYRGRVEVSYAGIWGTIDDNGWDIFDATVVCRQLGFEGAITAFTGSGFGKGKGPTWLSDVDCNGNETKLSQCLKPSSVKLRLSGNHEKDAGVECFSARLFGGKNPDEGIVQIQYRGKWGTICGKGWNMNAAHVVCRNLGYKRAKTTELVAKGREDVLLSEVKCKGDEESIMLCLHLGLSIHKCDGSKVAKVECGRGDDHQEVSQCHSLPCKNNGECIGTRFTFSCVCPRNFTDDTCQTYIGNSIVGVLLKGGISQWDPLQFMKSLAKLLNTFCSDCKEKPIRSKREESDTTKPWSFAYNDIIIVQGPFSRSPPGFLYVEFAVVKKINEKTIVVDSERLQKAIERGREKGIAGFKVIGYETGGNNETSYNVPIVFQYPMNDRPSSKPMEKSSDGFKTGFIAVVVIMVCSLLIIMAALVAFIVQRRKKNPHGGDDYQLRPLDKKSKSDNQILLNEEDNHFL